MGILKQLIGFAGSGLDYDSDKRALSLGDSTKRVNVSTNELGREFVISNMKGTTKKAHGLSHASAYDGAVYTVIGSCYDDNRDAVYIAIYSDLTNHCILRFNYSDDSFDKIAWDHTGLGFNTSYPLTDMYMIGDILHWNPRTSSPRAINVEWAYWDFVAYDRSTGTDGTYWNVNDYVTDRNKVFKILAANIRHDANLYLADTVTEFTSWCYQDVDTHPGSGTFGAYVRYREFYNTPIRPFVETPYIDLTNDTTFSANYIRGNIFQFAYRFYVPGQGYTISSTFSAMIKNHNDESFDGEIVEDITVNNVIEVGINIGDDGNNNFLRTGAWLWEFVEILFRKNDETDWNIVDRMYHDTVQTRVSSTGGGVTTYVASVMFYNDRSYELVDSAAIEKPYNPLPLLANSQWSLDGERTAYGGITEGQNDLTQQMAVTLTPLNRPVSLRSQSYPSPVDTFGFTMVEDPPFNFTYTSDSISAGPSGGTTPWVVTFEIFGQVYEGIYADATPSAAEYLAAILEVMNQSPITAYDDGNDHLVFSISTPVTPSIKVYDSTTGSLITKVRSYKTNARHPHCIYYYDDMYRRGGPQIQAEDGAAGTNVFIPSLPEEGTLTLGTNHQQYLEWDISHDAPSWAKYWRWGYAGNQNVSQFWQYNIESIVIGTSGLAGYALVSIAGLQTISNEASGNTHVHVNSNIGSYYFEPGDRIRFITRHTGTATSTTDLTLAASEYDYEIKGFDTANFLIYIDNAACGGTPYTLYDGNETVVEIYRPSKDPDNLEYNEIGPLYAVVLSSGRYLHKGETRDQTTSLSAQGELPGGDVYLTSREVASHPPSFTGDDVIFMESYNWSDFYDSDSWGKGKIGIISGIGQVELNNVRYSNKYSPNTLSSGVAEFDALDYKPLSSENGKITAMRQAGHVLKVYFERNSASIMVNKAQFLDADGISQIVKSDNVLGTVEYSNYLFGTIFPESVILIDRTVYFYDIYRKAYIRDSSNGIFAISDYKAVSKFNEISEALLTSGVSNVKVWTGYDPERKFVYVMIKDSNTSANDLVLVFNEKKNRWECTVDLTAGVLLRNTARDLISFIGEDLYIHNDNVNRGYFYDGYKTAVLDIVVNEQPMLTKLLDTITLNTNNGDWVITAIEIPPTPNYPYGMSSQISNAMFTNRENGMHAEFLRNMKTHQATNKLIDLRNGDPLRGQTATITLENAAMTEVVLFDVIINMTPSKI